MDKKHVTPSQARALPTELIIIIIHIRILYPYIIYKWWMYLYNTELEFYVCVVVPWPFSTLSGSFFWLQIIKKHTLLI